LGQQHFEERKLDWDTNTVYSWRYDVIKGICDGEGR